MGGNMKSIAAAIFASMILTAAGHAETIITTQWDDITFTQQECLTRAEKAIHEGDFKNLPHTETTRHGTRGQYTAAVRCLGDKKIVFFVVAGPEAHLTERYLDGIRDHF